MASETACACEDLFFRFFLKSFSLSFNKYFAFYFMMSSFGQICVLF